jgi:hypothetical protein
MKTVTDEAKLAEGIVGDRSMTDIETRALQNQIEIMWTLSYLLKCAKPDLVGRAGELDRMCADLADASKSTKALLDATHALTTPMHGDS